MSLKVRPQQPDQSGCVLEVTPETAGWKHVGFKVVKLAIGQVYEGGSPDREACIVILTGTGDVRAGDVELRGLGGRTSVFEDVPPAAVYAPAGASYRIEADCPMEIAIGSAPGQPGLPPRLIDPAAMSREVRGKGTNQRFVRNILPETEPADSLLIVEVITPGGHWSSYPPHKHDTAAAGEETALEETYYHRLNPPQGFAFQRVYTDDRSLDETMAVEDGDVTLVPRGYHPCAACHGYDLYYLNVMAGPRRTWKFHNAAEHEWLLKA
jgi:5-deoxy-glucuronate isomerase